MRPMSPIEPEKNVEKYDKRILTFSLFWQRSIPSIIICNNESCLLNILVTKEQLPGLRLRMEMYKIIYHNLCCLGIFFQIISYRTFSQGNGPMSYVHKVFTDSLWTKDTCLGLNRKGIPGRSSLHA